jgi:protein SCO1/2
MRQDWRISRRPSGAGRGPRLQLVICLLVAVAASSCAFGRDRPPAPSFQLVDQHGQLARLDDLHGRTVLLTFLYSNCPDTCPLYLANLSATVHALLERGEEAPAVVVVTVDPDRDTVERLRAFATPWPRDWLFLTGSYQQVSDVWRQYGIAVEKRPLEGSSDVHVHHGYAVVHSAKLFVLDPSGLRQAELTGDWTAQELTATLGAARTADGGPSVKGVLAVVTTVLRRCGELAARRPGLFFGLTLLVVFGALVLPTLLLRTFLGNRPPATAVTVPGQPYPSRRNLDRGEDMP